MFRRVVMPLVLLAAILTVGLIVQPSASGAASAAVSQVPRHDQYTFGRDAAISQRVPGSVQVYGGSAHVRDVVEGDLLVFGGNVDFSGAGRVNGNVIYAGGRVTNAGGRVGGRVYSLATLEGAAVSLTKNAVILSLLLVWLIAAVVVTLASGREVRLSSIEIRASALHCFALGLVAVTSFVLTAIVFSYLIPYLIGIPLLAALAVFAILTKIYGMVAVFHAVGTLVAGSRTREQLISRKWLRGDLAMVVIGVLILGALRMIPVIGPIIWSLASVFGIGVALATKFGRREPWFLEFRSAVA
jgi:hypothetical protein